MRNEIRSKFPAYSRQIFSFFDNELKLKIYKLGLSEFGMTIIPTQVCIHVNQTITKKAWPFSTSQLFGFFSRKQGLLLLEIFDNCKPFNFLAQEACYVGYFYAKKDRLFW